MPLYTLSSIYLGSDSEAKELYALVKTISKKDPKRFRSQNEFFKHCLLFTMENDPDVRRMVKQAA